METDPGERSRASETYEVSDDARVSRSSRGKKSVVGGKSCRTSEVRFIHISIHGTGGNLFLTPCTRTRILWLGGRVVQGNGLQTRKIVSSNLTLASNKKVLDFFSTGIIIVYKLITRLAALIKTSSMLAQRTTTHQRCVFGIRDRDTAKVRNATVFRPQSVHGRT